MAKKRSDYGVDVTYIDTTGTGSYFVNSRELSCSPRFLMLLPSFPSQATLKSITLKDSS